jgi:hypothetical protein
VSVHFTYERWRATGKHALVGTNCSACLVLAEWDDFFLAWVVAKEGAVCVDVKALLLVPPPAKMCPGQEVGRLCSEDAFRAAAEVN